MAPASRTPAEAVEHYRGLTARLLGCLTSEYVVVSAYHAADPPHQLELLDLAKLRTAHPLRLSVGEHYEAREDADGWRVEVVGYNYAIEHDGRDLVSYHWHPKGESPITWPHMRVGTDIQVGVVEDHEPVAA